MTQKPKKLREVSFYLNDAGKERYQVFTTLGSIANFAATATEFIELTEDPECMTKYDLRDISSFHAAGPMRVIRRLAEQEKAIGGTDHECTTD